MNLQIGDKINRRENDGWENREPYGGADECQRDEVGATDWLGGDETRRSFWKRSYFVEPCAGEQLDFQLLPEEFGSLVHEIQRSKEILELEEDWDEEGSKGYEKNTWNRAVQFLLRYAQKMWLERGIIIQTPMIGPGPNGSIDVHWESDERELLANIPRDPTRMAGFYGDDKGKISIKGTFDPLILNQGLLEWLSDHR